MPPGPVLMAGLADVDPSLLDEVRALEYANAMERLKSFCDAQRHEALATFAAASARVPDTLAPGAARLVQVGGAGTPAIDEFAICEFAAAAHLSEHTARAQLAVAQDLRHRLPWVLQALREGVIAGWRARLVAEATRTLSVEQVALAQARIMPILSGLGAKRLTELVKQVVIDTDPDAAEDDAQEAQDRRHVILDGEDDHGLVSGGFCADAADALRFNAAVDRVADWLGRLGDTDPKPIRRAKALGILANPHQLLDLQRRATESTPPAGSGGRDRASREAGSPAGPWPETTLYVHFTAEQWAGTRNGAATLDGVGPITMSQARDILGHAFVTLRPVIDLDNMPSSDDRFVRGMLREAMVVKNPTCVFPYCSCRSRTCQGDHNIAWPRGHTVLSNLGPLHPKHHRAKTFAGWHCQQPFHGIYLFKSPHGRIYLVDHRGHTHDIGLPPGA